jgi:DNA-binding NtrC family response regulator
VKETVLIAESDTELCQIYQRFLKKRGYKVEAASDGVCCVEKLRQLVPAVLVLDQELQWGGADGVLAWLREQTADVPMAVILTATAGGCSDDAASALPPVVTFLAKPFALLALLVSVRAAVAKKEREERLHPKRASAGSELYLR